MTKREVSWMLKTMTGEDLGNVSISARRPHKSVTTYMVQDEPNARRVEQAQQGNRRVARPRR